MAEGLTTAPKRRRYAGEEIGGAADAGTLASATAVLTGTSTKGPLRRILPFLGPAFIACIAYIDPGNFATNIQGGAQFGYLLVWVIVAANLMAMLIQALSAKLGIATGQNLPETIGQRFPKPVVWFFWGQAELIAMATDLAEFLGAAIGFNLLFGIPLFWSAVITGFATFGILALQNWGFRPLEAIIAVLVFVIGGCYVIETFLGKPDAGLTLDAFLPPKFSGTESVLLATGILGATVMPHVIYLHSALTQGRIEGTNPVQKRKIFRFELIDIVIAMGIAGFVNASMLLMAAVTFHTTGIVDIEGDLIFQAYETLTPLLGGSASVFFGISLVAAGLSSSAVGTMSGQVIMRGFLGWNIPLYIRRLVTMIPAFVVILLAVPATQTLVLSQVVLSFGIPFALVPLLIFTSRRDLMGDLVNHRVTTVVAWIIAAVIIALNLYLLFDTFFG